LGRLTKFFLVLLLGFGLRACVLEPFRFTDDSMAPTYFEGDLVFVSKLSYGLRVPGAGTELAQWSQPELEDLVVAVNLGDPPQTLLRRIKGKPGMTVVGGDGQNLSVKEGEFFLLSDSMAETVDSRKFGLVPKKNIVGKVIWGWSGKKSSTPDQSKVESLGSLSKEVPQTL